MRDLPPARRAVRVITPGRDEAASPAPPVPPAPPPLAQRAFLGAAVYGLFMLLPQYFLEGRLDPPTTHPEQFYGFVGVALAWQVAFLVIARDPLRHRTLMPVAALEKVAFGVPALVLFAQGRAGAPVLLVGLVDLGLGALFVAAYLACRPGAPGEDA